MKRKRSAAKAETGRSIQRRIWSVACKIPYGKVASYGQIADLAGYRRGARLVAPALRRAPREMRLPWHRIINAQGRISFPKNGSAYREQAERLSEEGVELINGRIDLDQFGWQPTLDELLFGPEPDWLDDPDEGDNQ